MQFALIMPSLNALLSLSPSPGIRESGPRRGRFRASHLKIDGRAATTSRFPGCQQEGIDLAMRHNRAVQVPAGAMRLRNEGLPPVAHDPLGGRRSAAWRACCSKRSWMTTACHR